MKIFVAKSLAFLLIKIPLLENVFRYCCSNYILRKYFKLGAVAFGFIHFFHSPELRVAKLSSYQLLVNIAEPLGIKSYFLRDSGTAWFLKDLIGEGDICIDAGANMGHYAFFMASQVGSQGKVIAFEPQPQYWKMIQKSINLNNWESFVIADNRALWKKSGDVLKFYLSEDPHNSGVSSLLNHSLSLNENNSIQVGTISLSDYLLDLKIINVKFVKIDVERVEIDVLQGFKRFLKDQKVNYILLETYAHCEAQRFLEDLGYYCVWPNTTEERFIDIHKVPKNYFGDYLFISSLSWDDFQSRL